MRHPTRLALLALLGLGLGLAALVAEAQLDMLGDLPAEPEGMEAYREARAGRHIKAREMAEALLERRPDSYVGHYVLGFVHHYGEANFARALFHHRRARALYAAQHGEPPRFDAPEQWHSRILEELVWTFGDLERYEDQLGMMALHAENYEPSFIAERAWPLMKLRRFDDARLAARLGQASGDSRQAEIALNALCAIEFEAGNHEASYEACRQAMELHGGDPARQGAVDFTNFAEAARSLFRLDEAERVDLLATRARVSWYGNPWVELAELYVRQGRFAEALDALKEVPRYRLRRPPHVQDADRNEARRALASFFLAVGRADDALRISAEALAAPDRRAHNSRDPAQDRAISALIDRGARRLRAERILEAAAAEPFYARVWAWVVASVERARGWQSGRVAMRQLADEERLVGTFMIGTQRSAVMPPWLVGDLVAVVGPGVAEVAIARARASDDRPGADAYYDAFAAEAGLRAGRRAEAAALAARALDGLGPSEAMLRVRMWAIQAEVARREGQSEPSSAFELVFQNDPGLLRRMELTLPVRFTVRGDAVAERAASALGRSPRLDETDGARMTLLVEATRAGGEVCLRGASGTVIECARVSAEDGEDTDALAARLVAAFHEATFAPRIDLSQADAAGLDGSSRVGRNALDTLFGHEAPPAP